MSHHGDEEEQCNGAQVLIEDNTIIALVSELLSESFRLSKVIEDMLTISLVYLWLDDLTWIEEVECDNLGQDLEQRQNRWRQVHSDQRNKYHDLEGIDTGPHEIKGKLEYSSNEQRSSHSCLCCTSKILS